jgi:hypothetical protein
MFYDLLRSIFVDLNPSNFYKEDGKIDQMREYVLPLSSGNRKERRAQDKLARQSKYNGRGKLRVPNPIHIHLEEKKDAES